MSLYMILEVGSYSALEGCRIIRTADPSVLDGPDCIDTLIEHAMVDVVTEWSDTR